MSISREASIPGRGKSKCKGPEASIGLAASRSEEEEVVMAGARRRMWRVSDQGGGSGQS